MSNGRVMIVEDDPLVADAIEINLESFGYEVIAKTDRAEEAIRMASEKEPDVILMDIMLAGEMDGIVAAQKIQDSLGIPIVFLTAFDDEQTLQRASITEPFGYILKPFSPRELNAILAMALYKSRSEKKLLESACSREVFSNLTDALVGLDRQHNILILNQSALQLFNVQEKSVINQDWSQLVKCVEPDEQISLQKKIEQLDVKTVSTPLWSTSLQTSSKSVLSVDISVCPVLKKNSLLYTVLIIRDVTERKKNELKIKHYQEHLEQLVKERTHELHCINQELDAYNYSVSHDLRSPLRAIDGFCRILNEDYATSFDEAGKNYLARIGAASLRMGQLIDDLLMLSRISMNDVVCEKVNLTHLSQELTRSLQERNPGRKFEFSIHPNMRVNADERLLRILLENLIGNAAKFTSQNKVAVIEIGEIRNNDQHCYFVHDNGVGFDMQYVDKIFRVFQRLHTTQQFEGSGVGLAISQRIVNKHHGEIWAESELDKGAWLYFTLEDSSEKKMSA